MKKLTIIAILSLVITCLVLGSTICFAEERPYYMVTSGDMTTANALPLYNDIDGKPSSEIACYIPPSYYFQSTTTIDGEYTKVDYNGTSLWAKTADISSKSSVDTTHQDIASAPYYSPAIELNKNLTDDTILKLFKSSSLEDTSDGRTRYFLEDVKSIKFVGFVDISTKTYFYVIITDTAGISSRGYFDPAMTNQPDLTLAKVPTHPNSVVVPPTDDTPTINPNNPQSPATNNLVRNILIGVICVLCVVIVFLIFKPSHKAN